MSSYLNRAHSEEMFNRCDSVLFRTYLEALLHKKYALAPPPKPPNIHLVQLNFSSTVADLTETLLMLMHTFHNLGSCFAYIIHHTSTLTTYYICFSLAPHFPSFSLESLTRLLAPHIICTPLSMDLSTSLLKDTLIGNKAYHTLTCTSTFQPLTSSPTVFETLFTHFNCIPFTYILLNTPCPLSQYQLQKNALTNLQAELFPFRSVTFTDDCLHTTLSTDNHSSGETGYDQNTHTHFASHTNVHGATDTLNKSYTLSSRLYEQLNLSPILAKNKNTHYTCTQGKNLTDSSVNQTAFSSNQSDSHSQTKTNKSIKSSTYFSQTVSSMLALGDEMLSFYDTNLTPPLFDSASYFLTPDSFSGTFMGSTLTHSLTKKHPYFFPRFTHVVESHTSYWDTLVNTLCTLTHPAFYDADDPLPITPALPWNCHAITKLMTPPL